MVHKQRKKKSLYIPISHDTGFVETVIENDNVLVAGDFHIPFVNKEYLEKLIDTKEEYNVKTLLINGDFFDMENIMFQRHGTAQASETFKQEISYVKRYLKSLSDEFEHIYISSGNHEASWVKYTHGLSSVSMLYDMCKKPDNVEITEADYMILESDGVPFRVCHPKNFSRIPLSVGRVLASKYSQNIISGHSHTCARGTDVSGKWNVIDNGGMFDSKHLKYIAGSTTTYPAQKNGFSHVIDGEVYVIV